MIIYKNKKRKLLKGQDRHGLTTRYGELQGYVTDWETQ